MNLSPRVQVRIQICGYRYGFKSEDTGMGSNQRVYSSKPAHGCGTQWSGSDTDADSIAAGTICLKGK